VKHRSAQVNIASRKSNFIEPASFASSLLRVIEWPRWIAAVSSPFLLLARLHFTQLPAC
jgi:hypothetical protein